MAKNREVIQLHIGQAGVQIANACWELYCLEHGICLDGTFCETYYGNDFNAFFNCNELCKCVPRLVMADLEPTPIDEIRNGCYRHLFHPQSLVTGKEDAASCFARGYCDLGHELIDLTMDRIRRVVEECSSPQGIIMFRAVGGGTGSGFGTLLLEQLSNEYGKMCKHEYVVFPSPRISPIIVEPYNAVLAAHSGLDYADVSFLFDNEACYEVCGRNLDICKPTYTNLNRLIGQVVSAATASLRFDGAVNVDLLEFATNLVPYPRIHFPLMAYAPLLPLVYSDLESLAISKITDYCFDVNYQLTKCDPQAGKYMSCCMLYRGDIYPNEVNRAIKTVKERETIQFVDWSPCGVKIGINYQPPTFVPGSDIAPVTRAVCMLANTTSIRAPLQRILKKFAKLYTKKSFLHHYLDEGLEETCFYDAQENIHALILAFKEVEN